MGDQRRPPRVVLGAELYLDVGEMSRGDGRSPSNAE